MQVIRSLVGCCVALALATLWASPVLATSLACSAPTVAMQEDACCAEPVPATPACCCAGDQKHGATSQTQQQAACPCSMQDTPVLPPADKASAIPAASSVALQWLVTPVLPWASLHTRTLPTQATHSAMRAVGPPTYLVDCAILR